LIPYFTQPSVSFGPLTIHAFGVIVAFAVFAGLTIGGRRFRRLGLDRALGERLAWWAVVGGFLGAHLFSVLFYFPHEVAENPLVLFKLWENISSFGGILGGMIGIWLFFRLRTRSIGTATRLAYVDVAAFVFPISLMIGRIACSLAHDHPGTVADFPLAVSLESAQAREYIKQVYADAGRLAELPPAQALAQLGFHDLGWYEFLYLTAVVVPAVLLLARRARAPGFFLAAFILLYMPARFVLDFLRVADVRYAGLTPAQWAALAALLGFATIIVHARRRPGAPPAGYTPAPNVAVSESAPLDTAQEHT
jgi:phosphatidylglycerol:prolipoprotein diacylglycerol transferase